MSRVLITGGADALGGAIARRLLSDPAFELRISDERPLPPWMREGCEVHRGDLRQPKQALAAARGCSHVIHLAPFPDAASIASLRPHALLQASMAADSAVVGAALEREVERLVFVSSAAVFGGATLFPTPEEHLARCATPSSASGFAALSGERLCRAAHEEHGLPITICRPFGSYGGELYRPNANGRPESGAADGGLAGFVAELTRAGLGAGDDPAVRGSGTQTCTPTRVEDLADGVIAALRSPAAVNEDFNLAASAELTLQELAARVWRACGHDSPPPELRRLPATPGEPQRSWPSVEKARELLGWEAQIGLEEGLRRAVESCRGALSGERASVPAGR